MPFLASREPFWNHESKMQACSIKCKATISSRNASWNPRHLRNWIDRSCTYIESNFFYIEHNCTVPFHKAQMLFLLLLLSPSCLYLLVLEQAHTSLILRFHQALTLKVWTLIEVSKNHSLFEFKHEYLNYCSKIFVSNYKKNTNTNHQAHSNTII